jgi:hypothetical protein
MPNEFDLVEDNATVAESTVRVHIPGDAFGYRGNVTKERKLVFAFPVSQEEAAQKEHELVDVLTTEIINALKESAAKVAEASANLPRPAAPGFTQASPVPAPGAGVQQPVQAVANAASQAGVAALVNGTAAPDTGIVSVKGKFGPVHFPHPQALDSRSLQDGVLALLGAPDIQVHPTQVRVFDNRTDMLNGRESGSMAAVKVARAGSQDAQNELGNKALAWVDWDVRSNRVVIKPTREFKSLPLHVRQELTQPASPQMGNPF